MPEIPRYTLEQKETLDLLDTISLENHIAFKIKIKVGRVIFTNNEEILHGRTGFDYPENRQRP